MKTIIFTVIILFSISYGVKAQDNMIIEMPESYELSNIILALTEYGKTDPWEVQKNSQYYHDLIKFFEPVKDHPLLDSVNYSRDRWEEYLAFRTDAFAFSFDKQGNLKREVNFYSVSPQVNPFDKHLDLINDFVKKSKFREFFNANSKFYKNIVKNYQEYYFIEQTVSFLDKVVGKSWSKNGDQYLIALSPLVFRMNCHRNIDEYRTADFPSLSLELINGKLGGVTSRVIENHTIFTEMDHGYINPVSSLFSNLIASNFDNAVWDSGSGYNGINSFNEYMTWAVYDLFVKENFPKVAADSIITQWHYQNASRGFIASNLFAQKVEELYNNQKNKNIKEIYPSLLEWCKEMGPKIIQPVILKINKEITTTDINITLHFSEKMATGKPFGIQISELKENRQTAKSTFTVVNDYKWEKDGKTLNFKINTDYNSAAILFNFWGIDKPLVSETGMFLKPMSYIIIR